MNQASTGASRSRRYVGLRASTYWPAFQLNIAGAFLQITIDDAIFAKPAQGHKAKHVKTVVSMVMKLKASLYEPSQSPTLWHVTIDDALLGIGFMPTLVRRCIYEDGSNGTFTIQSVYVH